MKEIKIMAEIIIETVICHQSLLKYIINLKNQDQ